MRLCPTPSVFLAARPHGCRLIRNRRFRNVALRSPCQAATVSRLFKDRLHSYEQCHICFAKRGQSERTQAFENALSVARQRFALKWAREVTTQVHVQVKASANEPCLQAADYFLWALQRHYRSGESRFIEAMWEKVGIVHAVDELDQAPYGNYYTKKKPLPAITGAAS